MRSQIFRYLNSKYLRSVSLQGASRHVGIDVTWQLSFDHVEQRNRLSANLLRLWAYFGSQDLWFELLRHSDSKDPDWIRELAEDELSFHGAVRVLSDHGLVEVDTSSQELIESRGYTVGCSQTPQQFN
jgi:hypothetical protein